MIRPFTDKASLVNDFLEQSAARTPGKTALVFDGRRLTYAEIDAMADKMANALVKSGIGRGDRVVICLHNSVEMVVAIFATLKAGGVFVPVNATTRPGKLLYLVRNCRAFALVLPANKRELADRLIHETPSIALAVLTGGNAGAMPKADNIRFFEDIQRTFEPVRPPCAQTPRSLACLIYTSGSTGKPKGVMSGHDNVVFASGSIITYLGNTPDDIILNVLPLSFDYGLYQLLMAFRFGGTLVLERSFAYPAKTLNALVSEKATGFPIVPTIAAVLLNMDLSVYDLSRLRYITNTAAALPASHIRGIREKFPKAALYSMYGLTETKRTLYLPPDQLDTRPGSVGIPIPGTEAWVADDHGNRLGPNQTGELVIRGPHVMRGYWEDAPATAERYRRAPDSPDPDERLCHSGDLFYTDDEGYFYFVGRRDDIIKSRGEKVAPREVESILHDLPDVIDAAVAGVPDPLLGEAVKAYLVVRPCSALTEQDVLRHCRANLEDFMVPRFVEFRDALPRNAGSKVMKAALARPPKNPHPSARA